MSRRPKINYVDQDEYTVPGSNKYLGCLTACIASIVLLNKDQILYLERLIYQEESSRHWIYRLADWLKERGYVLAHYHEYDPGYNTTCIACGDSMNEHHAVLWRDGKMTHDPHPSRQGLQGKPTYYIYLFPNTILTNCI